MKTKFNQKLIHLIEYYSLINANIFVSKKGFRSKKTENNFKTGNKELDLKKLKESIKKIDDHKIKPSAKNIVFGDGNINAKLMIIGEAPGAQEDLLGLPFVGRAGKLLDKMLAAIKLNRRSVYITNVINYRPPENRKPSEDEIDEYLPYLIKHIQIINPRVILLLGSTALNAILGSEKVISKARGVWHRELIGENEFWILASFHPAFLMRQPDQKKFAWVDLKMIREKLKLN